MSLENSLERIKDLMNLNESDSQFKRRVSIEVIDEYFQMYLDQAMTNLPKFEDLSDWQIKGLIDTIIWNTVFSLMSTYIGVTEYIDMFSLFEKLKSFYRTRIMDSFRSERNNDDEQPGENFLNEIDLKLKRRIDFNYVDEYFQRSLDELMIHLPKSEELSDWRIKDLIDTVIWDTTTFFMDISDNIRDQYSMYSIFDILHDLYRDKVINRIRSERNNDNKKLVENFLNENNTYFLKRRINFDNVEDLVDLMIVMEGQIPDEMSFDDFCNKVLWKVSGILEMRHEIDLNFTQLNELVDMLKEMFHEKLFITYFQQKDNSLNTNIQENISRISQLMGISENTYIKRRIESDKIEKAFSFYLDYLLNDLNHYEWEGYPDLPIKDMKKFINRVINFVTLAIWNDFDEYFHNHPEEKEGISTMIRNSFEDRIRDSFIEKITSNYKKNTEFNSNL